MVAPTNKHIFYDSVGESIALPYFSVSNLIYYTTKTPHLPTGSFCFYFTGLFSVVSKHIEVFKLINSWQTRVSSCTLVIECLVCKIVQSVLVNLRINV